MPRLTPEQAELADKQGYFCVVDGVILGADADRSILGARILDLLDEVKALRERAATAAVILRRCADCIEYRGVDPHLAHDARVAASRILPAPPKEGA